MSRVFVVQEPHHRDPGTGEIVPKFDLSSAQMFGELVYLLSPTAAPWSSASIIAELHEKLADYTEDDYLLLIGNPALMTWAGAIAAEHSGGVIKQLQWRRWPGAPGGGKYVPVRADLFPKSLGF